MSTPAATTTRTERCNKAHTLKVLLNPRGGYHVTCEYCDWWSSIPAGERLKGWDDRVNVLNQV